MTDRPDPDLVLDEIGALRARVDELRDAHARAVAALARLDYAQAIGAAPVWPAYPIGYVVVWTDANGTALHPAAFASYGGAWRTKQGLRAPEGRKGGAWTIHGIGPTAEPRKEPDQ